MKDKAKIYDLDLPSLSSIEFPFIVKNPEKALLLVGGSTAVSKVCLY